MSPDERPRSPHRDIKGCLVYGRLKPEAEEKRRRLREDGITVVTWDRLLEDAERFHREFLEIVKSRAPEDDPRVQEPSQTRRASRSKIAPAHHSPGNIVSCPG